MRRFTVAEYERLEELGILRASECVDLREGWIAWKKTHVPPELLINGPRGRLRRFTVDEYHQMIQGGVLREKRSHHWWRAGVPWKTAQSAEVRASARSSEAGDLGEAGFHH